MLVCDNCGYEVEPVHVLPDLDNPVSYYCSVCVSELELDEVHERACYRCGANEPLSPAPVHILDASQMGTFTVTRLLCEKCKAEG